MVKPHLVECGYGRIVSTSSNLGLLGNAGLSGYAAAKAGIWGLTSAWRLKVVLVWHQRQRHRSDHFYADVAKCLVWCWSRGGQAKGERAGRAGLDKKKRRADLLAHEQCTQTGEVWSVAGGRVVSFRLGLTYGFDSEALNDRGSS